MSKYPQAFLDLCASITDKRPKTVIDHILRHGHITTEELKNLYGYNHPPRAARDVREKGIPLETFFVKGTDGRKIAAYRFADTSHLRFRRIDGRTALSKILKEKLIERYGCKCFIYLEKTEESELQIDHRIPFEIAGESEESNPDNFMLLSASANRAKSWACEHCENRRNKKDKKVCLSCYWAFPENYKHVAMRRIRRLDLIWEGKETTDYERLKNDATKAGKNLPDFVKELLASSATTPSPSPPSKPTAKSSKNTSASKKLSK